MSNLPLERRLAEANAFFVSLLKPMLWWLLLMSLIRLGLWLTQMPVFSAVSGLDLMKCFGTGARFDLLVIGFILIPVVLAVQAAVIFGVWGQWLERSLKWALSVMWTILTVFSFCDFIFFTLFHRRWSSFDAQLSGLSYMHDGIATLGYPMMAVILIGFLFIWFMGSRKAERAISVLPSATMLPLWKQAAVIFWPLLAVGLMARGTVTAHHLEKAHSEISTFPPLNELTVNALWAFDKEPGA